MRGRGTKRRGKEEKRRKKRGRKKKGGREKENEREGEDGGETEDTENKSTEDLKVPTCSCRGLTRPSFLAPLVGSRTCYDQGPRAGGPGLGITKQGANDQTWMPRPICTREEGRNSVRYRHPQRNQQNTGQWTDPAR